MQRTLDHSALPLGGAMVTACSWSPNKGSLLVSFKGSDKDSSSNKPVEFSKEFLAANAFDLVNTTQAASRYGLVPMELWGENAKQLPIIVLADARSNPHKVLAEIARMGACVIKEMPLTQDGTEEVLRSVVGPPRETFYGRMWDTAPKREVNDTAYTNLALEPHTDCTYLTDTPGLQCFNCVAQSDPGVSNAGATHLVDSFAMIEFMRKDNPEAFKFFCTVPLVFHHIEKDVNVRAVRKVINLDPYNPEGPPVQFAYNMYDLAPVTYLPHTFERIASLANYYKHTRYLNELIRSTRHSILTKLQVGDCLIVDNHRIMHGRTAFTGYRNLVGCYVGVDDWTARLRSAVL